jgi:hypothetical protein
MAAVGVSGDFGVRKNEPIFLWKKGKCCNAASWKKTRASLPGLAGEGCGTAGFALGLELFELREVLFISALNGLLV